jgi:hypothetical protein
MRAMPAGARLGVVVAAALLLVGLPLLDALSATGERLSSTNAQSPVSGSATALAPAARVCVPNLFLPAGTSAMRVYLSVAGGVGGPVAVTIRDQARIRLEAAIAPGYGTRPVTVPIGRVRRDVAAATACFENRGTQTVTLANADNGVPNQGLKPLVAAPGSGPRVDFLLGSRISGWGLLPRIVDRAVLMKPSWVRPWIVWVLLVTLLAGGVAGVLVVARGRD